MKYIDTELEYLKAGDLAYIFTEGFGPEKEDMVPIITWCILILEPPKIFNQTIKLRGISAPIQDYYEPTDGDMELYAHDMINKWVKEKKFIEQLPFKVDDPEEYVKIADPPNFRLEDKKAIVTEAFFKK